jgi:serine/threonine-protein kinase
VAPGDLLAGKYRVERVLGVGGMGIVVSARHLQLDELVAVKFLREKVMDEPEIVVRFLREARAVAKLKSEHVVRVRDVGNLDNGAPYIVMEYLDGETLKEKVKRDGKFPIGHAVDCILHACDALAEAHAHGIVHRDIKPTNLFLTKRPDGRALVKVFDFGISKHTQPEGGEQDGELGMTATTSMLGSPLYMSPEQMISSRNVDARTDIWSLGVTLYLLVSGAMPFRADTVPGVCALVLGEAPKRLDEVMSGVPSGLADIVARCLAKDPDKRYASVAELAADLESFGTEQSAGAAKRVASMLRVPVPPPSSRSHLVTLPSNTTIKDGAAVATFAEQTDVSFGEASGAPRSIRAPRRKGPIVGIGLGIALGVAVGISAIVMGRGTPAPATSAASMAAQPAVADTASTVSTIRAVPPPTAISAPLTPSSDGDAGVAAVTPVAAPKAAPTKPKLAAPPSKPGFDPGSYR